MITLSDSVALAQPLYPQDLAASVHGFHEIRSGRRTVEVRIGVGALSADDIPLRVLGYAACMADAIKSDAIRLAGRVDCIVIFSSAPKAGFIDLKSGFRPIAALAGALRLVGVDAPIILETANSANEIPEGLRVGLEGRLRNWIADAATHNYGHFGYAFEHAAPSMFADLAADANEVFRLTIGGRTEAPFWAVRMRVREAALKRNDPVTPAAGLILKALRRPWYCPTPHEPCLAAMAEPIRAITELDRAANPSADGNAGLTRESRALRRIINHVDHVDIQEFVKAFASVSTAMQFVRQSNFVIGQRLAAALDGE